MKKNSSLSFSSSLNLCIHWQKSPLWNRVEAIGSLNGRHCQAIICSGKEVILEDLRRIDYKAVANKAVVWLVAQAALFPLTLLAIIFKVINRCRYTLYFKAPSEAPFFPINSSKTGGLTPLDLNQTNHGATEQTIFVFNPHNAKFYDSFFSETNIPELTLSELIFRSSGCVKYWQSRSGASINTFSTNTSETSNNPLLASSLTPVKLWSPSTTTSINSVSVKKDRNRNRDDGDDFSLCLPFPKTPKESLKLTANISSQLLSISSPSSAPTEEDLVKINGTQILADEPKPTPAVFKKTQHHRTQKRNDYNCWSSGWAFK